MKKDTLLYKGMKKYRRKFLVILIFFAVLLIAFTIWRLPYIKTQICGAVDLDVNRFLSETETFSIDDVIELNRHESKEPESYYYKDISYWQGDNYLFKMEVDSLKETGIVYSNKISVSENNTVEYESAVIYTAEIGGRKTVVIASPHEKCEKSITGLLVKAPRAVMSDLSKSEELPLTLCEYFIDCRGIDMGTESSDFTIVKIGALILILLFVKLGIYYVKPELTPTYRQLRKYGNIMDVADDVEAQINLDSAYTEDKMLITEDYIITDDTFKKKVVKNHMVN